jgi:hypothetical protein
MNPDEAHREPLRLRTAPVWGCLWRPSNLRYQAVFGLNARRSHDRQEGSQVRMIPMQLATAEMTLIISMIVSTVSTCIPCVP